MRWAANGTGGAFLEGGGAALCAGTPHGLTLAAEGGGTFLYHANCGTKPPRYGSGKLTKTDLRGNVVWQHDGPVPGTPMTAANYRPTWWVVPPTGDFVYLGDGYGSSNVYVFGRDGTFANKTFGGKGGAHGKFNNCHGLHWDPRSDQVVVADRENHRIEFYDVAVDGSFAYNHTVVPAYGIAGTQRPCNVRVLEGAGNATLNGLAVVADLGADDQSKPGVARGQVAVLDQSNALLSVIKVSELLGAQGSVHPHDAIMLANGDIVVATGCGVPGPAETEGSRCGCGGWSAGDWPSDSWIARSISASSSAADGTVAGTAAVSAAPGTVWPCCCAAVAFEASIAAINSACSCANASSCCTAARFEPAPSPEAAPALAAAPG